LSLTSYTGASGTTIMSIEAPLPEMLIAPSPIELYASTLTVMLCPSVRLKGACCNTEIGIVQE